MNPVHEFCDKKGLSDNLRKAFTAYCQSLFGKRYMMHEDGETVKLFMSRITEDQLNEAWLTYIGDLKSTMPHELSSDTPNLEKSSLRETKET